MFSKVCKKCGEKVSSEFTFCPYCGNDIKREEEERDYGLIGRRDELEPYFNTRMPFNLDKMFNQLLNEFDKQFKDFDNKSKENPKKTKIRTNGISINISTGFGEKPEIQIRGFSPEFTHFNAPKVKQLPRKQISEEKAKELASLPRKEAEAKVRRFSNKIVYEIDLPEVLNIDDVIINKLEKSIEIKALSPKTVYYKVIPITAPITNYLLKDGKLFLEFRAL